MNPKISGFRNAQDYSIVRITGFRRYVIIRGLEYPENNHDFEIPGC